MSTLTVALDLPRDLLGVLDVPHAQLETRLRELIALELFREGRISSGKGAELLVASKVVALVERGAPRDFRDIHALCRAGLTTPQECWELWRRRQQLAASDTDSARARLAVQTHLARMANIAR